MTPICCRCRVTMRCAKNEFIVRDPCHVGGGDVFSSTYWSGDKFKCPSCGHEIVVGFGKPVTAEKATELGWDKEAMEFNYEPSLAVDPDMEFGPIERVRGEPRPS